MKPVFILIIGLCCASPTYGEGVDTGTAQMACTNFPPFKIESKDTGTPHSGIDLEVIEHAFAITNQKVAFNFYPWKRAVTMVQHGKAHALCGCDYRAEREAEYIYSDMVGFHSQGVFIPADSAIKSIHNLQELAGKTVGTVRGYALEKTLADIPDIKIAPANNGDQLLRQLVNKRVDAIYAYRDVIFYHQKLNKETTDIRYFELKSLPYYVCFSRTIPDIRMIVDAFNQGIRTIRFNGTYGEIRQNYR
ncbi:substrate-binding periplasmic protein [Terasakiella pusilla]|uniref:substrate-binding periplasmic protein n=1 Tax=Terasakiella pusilla TaxID=64973 RepID=UPI00048C570C|nr:transporter substrate-binding domain-containing protein [Terasakiella pusilla]